MIGSSCLFYYNTHMLELHGRLVGGGIFGALPQLGLA